MSDGVVGIDFGVRRLAFTSLGSRWSTPDQYHPQTEEVYLRDVPPGEANDTQALSEIYSWALKWVSWWKPELVAIESPIQGVSVNVKVGLRLAQVVGALVVACRQAGSSTVLVGPTEWKKAITGHGNANKDQVTQWLSDNRPDLAALCETQDLVDSTCLALFAEARLEGRL